MSRLGRNVLPAVEHLETREVPAANNFANWMGQFTQPGVTAEVMPMSVFYGNFRMPRGEVLVGFNLRADAGSGFDPGSVQIIQRDRFVRGNTPVLFASSDTAADKSALTIAVLRPNQFWAHINGENGTDGHFNLETYLVGDANSDFRVDATDLDLITGAQGKQLGQTGYSREADANLDGIIDDADLNLAERNLGVSTPIRPLQIQATVQQNGVTDANGVIRTPNFVVQTQLSRPASVVYCDQDVNGSFETHVGVTPLGRSNFQLQADPGLNSYRFAARSGAFSQRAIRTVQVMQGNAVTEWNATLLQAITATGTPPPRASRAMAIVQGAIFDTLNAFQGGFQNYHTTLTPPAGANAEAAVAGAAYRTLSVLFPTQTALLDAARTNALSFTVDGQAETDGYNFGLAVGQEFLDLRASDNSSLVVPYTPGSDPGDWVPTPAAFAPALLPNWPQVTPFTMTTGDQFRPDGPPTLDSSAWAAAFNEVKDLGSARSTTRTADQTEIALFWADGGGTHTPPGHWNVIAQDVTARNGQNLLQTARTFALLNYAMADAGIAAWDAKYEYNFWRPITAIRAANSDGNAATVQDATWTPLIATPPFPEYTSGHSTFSGAADAVLTALFGNQTFRAATHAFSNEMRTFTSFSQAADEAGRSRIYGGIHYEFSNVDAKAAGRAIGQQAVANFLEATT